jgi:hypothetical protein
MRVAVFLSNASRHLKELDHHFNAWYNSSLFHSVSRQGTLQVLDFDQIRISIQRRNGLVG